ncbi:MAG: MarR family transcriptional regulator [Pseudanabaena sp.]|jgi:hypothetical protein
MTDKTFNYQISVPEGCMAKTVVTPIKMLTDNPHVRVFSEGLGRLAMDKDLNGTDIRVLLFILSIMEYENLLNTTQKALSEGLGIVQQEVSKSIKKLIEGGYLKIVDKNGRQNIYQLNPHLAFKSRAKNYRLLCSIWDEDDSQPDDSLEA